MLNKTLTIILEQLLSTIPRYDRNSGPNIPWSMMDAARRLELPKADKDELQAVLDGPWFKAMIKRDAAHYEYISACNEEWKARQHLLDKLKS